MSQHNVVIFFFSSRRRHTRCSRDWSSDVCSSDLLTGRGLGMAGASLAMVAVALSVKFAEFGVLAIASLGMMYLASTIATLTSAVMVRSFDDRVRRGLGAIDREMSPTVIDAGDPVQ